MLLADATLYNFLQVGVHHLNLEIGWSSLHFTLPVWTTDCGWGWDAMSWGEKFLSHDYDAANHLSIFLMYLESKFSQSSAAKGAICAVVRRF